MAGVGGPAAPLIEQVYRSIQLWINEGKFHPGEHLREAAICERLGVSRTPVRGAIRRLQAEGRVIIKANRGAVVAELMPQEMVELYTVRQELEGFAARLAAQHATETEIRLMETLLRQSRELADDPRALNQNNWKLHKTIYIAAHNRFLSQTFEALSGALALLRGIKYIPEDRPKSLYDEHAAIVDAIRDRDPETADAAAQKHIQSAFAIHLDKALGDPGS